MGTEGVEAVYAFLPHGWIDSVSIRRVADPMDNDTTTSTTNDAIKSSTPSITASGDSTYESQGHSTGRYTTGSAQREVLTGDLSTTGVPTSGASTPTSGAPTGGVSIPTVTTGTLHGTTGDETAHKRSIDMIFPIPVPEPLGV